MPRANGSMLGAAFWRRNVWGRWGPASKTQGQLLHRWRLRTSRCSQTQQDAAAADSTTTGATVGATGSPSTTTAQNTTNNNMTSTPLTPTTGGGTPAPAEEDSALQRAINLHWEYWKKMRQKSTKSLIGKGLWGEEQAKSEEGCIQDWSLVTRPQAEGICTCSRGGSTFAIHLLSSYLLFDMGDCRAWSTKWLVSQGIGARTKHLWDTPCSQRILGFGRRSRGVSWRHISCSFCQGRE